MRLGSMLLNFATQKLKEYILQTRTVFFASLLYRHEQGLTLKFNRVYPAKFIRIMDDIFPRVGGITFLVYIPES